METYVDLSDAQRDAYLETFLGGMETCLATPWVPSPCPLKPSLVEWKHAGHSFSAELFRP